METRHAKPELLVAIFPKYDGAASDEIFSSFSQWWFRSLGYKNMTLDLDSTVNTRFGEQEGVEVGYNPRCKGIK